MNLFRLDNLFLCVFGRLRFSSSPNLLVTIAFAFFFGCKLCPVKVFTMFCFVWVIIRFRALITLIPHHRAWLLCSRGVYSWKSRARLVRPIASLVLSLA